MFDKTIWEYELQITDIQILKMPKGAEIFSCQIQNNTACIWALVDPSKDKIERVIEIIGTGNPAFETLNVSRVFIDTIQIYSGNLVFHVFERVLNNA